LFSVKGLDDNSSCIVVQQADESSKEEYKWTHLVGPVLDRMWNKTLHPVLTRRRKYNWREKSAQ
jgi:hypothetical protein